LILVLLDIAALLLRRCNWEIQARLAEQAGPALPGVWRLEKKYSQHAAPRPKIIETERERERERERGFVYGELHVHTCS